MEDEGLSRFGAFAFLIARHGSQNDLAVGIPHIRQDNLGGIFISTDLFCLCQCCYLATSIGIPFCSDSNCITNDFLGNGGGINNEV